MSQGHVAGKICVIKLFVMTQSFTPAIVLLTATLIIFPLLQKATSAEPGTKNGIEISLDIICRYDDAIKIPLYG